MQQEWGNCCLSFAEHVVNQLFLDIPIVMCFKELLIGTEGTVYRAAGVGRWAGGEADIKEMVYGEVTIFLEIVANLSSNTIPTIFSASGS